MHHTHAARAQAAFEPIVAGESGTFRFRARPGVLLRRHATTPVLFVRARDARSLIDVSYGAEEAC